VGAGVEGGGAGAEWAEQWVGGGAVGYKLGAQQHALKGDGQEVVQTCYIKCITVNTYDKVKH
jgi:hypothetical protein